MNQETFVIAFSIFSTFGQGALDFYGSTWNAALHAAVMAGAECGTEASTIAKAIVEA